MYLLKQPVSSPKADRLIPISRKSGVSIVCVPFLNPAGHGGVTGKLPVDVTGSPLTVAHAESPVPVPLVVLQSEPLKIGCASQAPVIFGLSRHPPAPPVQRKPFTIVTWPPPVYSTTTRMSPSLWSPEKSTFAPVDSQSTAWSWTSQKPAFEVPSAAARSSPA